MNYLAFSWLLLPSLLAPAASEHTRSAQAHRDPFRTPQQEQAIDPTLFANRATSRVAQQLRQWRLHGVLGNPQRGLWGLVRTPTGDWHCLRVGELIMGYRVIAIGSRRLLLQRLQHSSETTAPPLSLPWVGCEAAELAAEHP
jgi:hypothetical protein